MTMTWSLGFFLAALLPGAVAGIGDLPLTPAGSASGGNEASRAAAVMEARVWLDRGDEPVLQRGDRARVYYALSEDAHAAIFHVDTNGTVRLLMPATPDDRAPTRGGRDYRLLFPRSSLWFVDEDPGMGYFFIVASPTPLDFSHFRYSHFEGGWDLSRVGRQIYRDPYQAMDDYVAALVPDWEWGDYALDFTAYHVGSAHAYPRFLCYDCHTFRPVASWNPYHYTCSSFRVVIYDDPYYYPVARYQGTRVVYTRPPVVGQPRFTFKERSAGEPGTPLLERRPPVAGPPVGTGGPIAPRRDGAEVGRPAGGQPPAVGDAPVRGLPGAGGIRGGEENPPTPLRRPSQLLQGQDAGRNQPPEGTRSVAPQERERPTLQRRPPPVSAAPPARSEPAPQTRPPARSEPPAQTRPPARSEPPAQTRPPARSEPPAQTRPPARTQQPAARSEPPPTRQPAQARPAPPSDPPPRNPPPPRSGGRSPEGS